MRPVTDRFAQAVTQPHQLAVETVVLHDDQETPVEIVEGGVTLDQTAAVRGRCDLTIAVDPDDDPDGLIPTGPSSLLAPYGNEIRVGRGIQYEDGTTEIVALGVFGIYSVDVDDGPDGTTLRVAGMDRAQRVINARFEAPYNQARGVELGAAILAVIQAAWPDVPVNPSWPATPYTTPAGIGEEGGDRWQFVQDMAAAASMRLYFDGDGLLTLAPDVLSDPVATIAEGESGVLVQASRTWTRDASYNAVIATGEATGEAAPSRGVAYDVDPESPTYYYGPFGRVPLFWSSPLLTTDAMAQAAAETRLRNQLGTTQQVRFGSYVLPHLEPGDTVTVTRARSGIGEDNVLDSITCPLGPEGVMQGQTRARQVV